MPFQRLMGTVALLLLLGSPAQAAPLRYTVTAPDGVHLAVEETGNPNGPAIIFIHGLLGSRLNWAGQTRAPLLQRYRMISYDLRGHGQSDKPADPSAYREGRRYADDLAAVIAASHSQRPVLVGWSLGGVVISNYLAAYGDAAISGALYVDGVIELNAEQIPAHPDTYAGLASDALAEHLDAIRAFLRLCFHTQPHAATFERLLANAAMASWPMTRAVPAMTVSVSEGLPKARVPVWLLYGGQDALVDPHASIARAKALNPRVHSRLYSNAGHAPFLEEPARFNQDLADFMQATQGERP